MTNKDIRMNITGNNLSSIANESIGQANVAENDKELRDFVTIIAYSRVLTVIVFIGIISNILNLITLSRKQFRVVFYVCLRTLAVADLLALLAVAPYTINLYSAKPKRTYSEAFYTSHVQLFLMKTFEGASVLTVVLMTIERYIALCMPLKAKSLLTRRRIFIGLFIVCVVSVSFNIPRIFERSVNTRFNMETNSTVYVSGGISDFAKGLYYTVHKYIYTAFFRVCCTLVIIIMNIRIIIQIQRSALVRTQSTARPQNMKSSRNEERRVTFMLLGVTALFLFSYIPPMYTYIVQDWELSFIGFVFFVASDVASQVNFAMNFFVYCCCSRSFRLALLDTLRCVGDKGSKSGKTMSTYSNSHSITGDVNASRTLSEGQSQSVQTISSTC